LTAGPDSPPVAFPSLLRMPSRSIAIPTNVLTAVTASAPPRSQARAVSRMSVTSGESLAMSGFSVSGRKRASVRSSRSGSAQ